MEFTELNNVMKTVLTKKDERVYNTKLLPLCKTINSTILFQRILYWCRIKKGKFFKFKMPCEHNMYKKGKSWTEEIGFSRDNINTALKILPLKKQTRTNILI